jgi:hypothetical protein
MFTADNVVDSITTAQKQVVKTFVKQEDMAEALTGLVDAHATNTKNMIKVGTDAVSVAGKEMVRLTQDITRYGYAKHVTESYEYWSKLLAALK